jgi:DNA-binding NarL/FixJ family response regulator
MPFRTGGQTDFLVSVLRQSLKGPCWRETDAMPSANHLVWPGVVPDDGRVAREVLIVDDNAGFRRRVRRCLEADGYTIVGEAADGAASLAAVRRLGPAVMLLDLQLPDMSGLAVAERLACQPGAPAVVLTSTHDATDFGDRLVRCGALGFVPKAELSCERLSALLAGSRWSREG